MAKTLLACLPSSPASALNSLTISTIKMCQKIFQFPYTQEGMQEREGECDRGRQEAAARSLHFSIFIKFFGNAPGQLIYGNKGALTVSPTSLPSWLPLSLSVSPYDSMGTRW